MNFKNFFYEGASTNTDKDTDASTMMWNNNNQVVFNPSDEITRIQQMTPQQRAMYMKSLPLDQHINLLWKANKYGINLLNNKPKVLANG